MSNLTNGTCIPRHLDDPAKLFLWDMDQALMVVGFFGVGMIVDMTMLGLFFGVGLGYGYGKLKAGRGRGFLMHAAYWYVGAQGRMRRTPHSSVRMMIG